MKIKNIKSRHRNDFSAVYECENCGSIEESYGYNDDYFHNHVIPQMRCKACGETSLSVIENGKK